MYCTDGHCLSMRVTVTVPSRVQVETVVPKDLVEELEVLDQAEKLEMLDLMVFLGDQEVLDRLDDLDLGDSPESL